MVEDYFSLTPLIIRLCEEFTACPVKCSSPLDTRSQDRPLAALAITVGIPPPVPYRHGPDSIKGARLVRAGALDAGPQSSVTSRLWGSCPAGR